MNVKIQGGGNGTYANTGSCVSVTNYLQHEDLERMKNGEEVQPFFNQFRDYVSAREVTFKIDSNKAKLSRTDAKFYVITVSPSEKELHSMGRTPQERAEALRRYIRQDVMRNYAEGFGKGLKSDDVEYYAKIHFNRDGDSDSDMHAHIIVSRKDRSNTKKLSSKTNHTGKKNCGNVKGGFDRTDFSGSVKALLIGAWGLTGSRRKASTTLTPSRTATRQKLPDRWSVRSASERRNGTISKRRFKPGRSRRGQKSDRWRKHPTSSSPPLRSNRRKIWNSDRNQKKQRFRHGDVIFLFSGTKVTPHAAFVKGRFTLRVKISCARFARAVFLPFALDKYSVLRWQVFRKKKKCCSLVGCPFCHSVTGICPHGGRTVSISQVRNIIL